MIERNSQGDGNWFKLISPLIDKVDSEKGHDYAKRLLALAETNLPMRKLLEYICSRGEGRISDERMNVEIEGIKFDNPIMIGAGWDKKGEALWAEWLMGFAATEVGSVLEKPQYGNPKPRQWHLKNPEGEGGVSFNRLGFNSPGQEVVAKNLERYTNNVFLNFPIGISVGKNKEVSQEGAPQAHAAVIKKMYSFASYFTINVSSPNTPGLRQLQYKGPLQEIVKASIEAMEECGGRKPLFIKIAPDMTFDAILDVLGVVEEFGLTGVVATNTTNNPDIKKIIGEKWGSEMGGLSGNLEEYRQMVLNIISFIFKETKGKKVIIGSGGVSTAQDAINMLRAGASMVQVVSAIRGVGPTVAHDLQKGIINELDKVGAKSVKDIVGENN
jgi:dihydroorotate dehydrogenase